MTTVCIACGPSLTKADVDYCRGKARVIVVNDSFRLAPWADWLWASDYDWWQAISRDCGEPNHALSKRLFSGARATLDLQAATDFGLHYFVSRNEKGFSSKEIHHGMHSGYAAINLAHLLGERERIVLLGYDLGGVGHWFGLHPTLKKVHPITKTEYVEDLERTQKTDYSLWCEEMKALELPIINCTRKTALTHFPQATIEEVL